MNDYVFSQYYSKAINVKIYAIDACNYSCEYCYNKRPRRGSILDLTAVCNFLSQVHIKFKKCVNIEIIGGEPTLHPNLIDFCKKAQSLHFVKNILIYTNFSKDSNYYAQMLSVPKVYLDISFHNIGKTIAKQFIKKLLHINRCTSFLDKISISVLAQPGNIEYAKNVYLILKQLGYEVDIVKIFNNISAYQCESTRSIKQYSSEELSVVDQLVENAQHNKQKNIHIKTSQLDQYFSEIEARSFCIENKNLFYKWKCLAGIRAFYIHSTGECYGCQQYYEMEMPPMFNIYDSKYVFNANATICAAHICAYEQYVTKWR